MPEPSLESLFVRYRGAGDLAAMAAVFDRTAPELLGLAAHLVRDPVEAEDLVQATFLAALEGARSFDPARRLAPWLAGILVRQAMRVQRERARRADPARLERAPVAEPSLLLEQNELAAALAGALDGLDEPYRSVLARHLGGERALDIARASGRAPGTVRMQILRGLERLRRALPAGLHGTALAPRGLEAVRAEVLARGGLGLESSPALASSLAGGLLVSTKLVVCAVAALALVLVVLSRSRREPEAAPAPAVSAASEVAGATLRALDEPPASPAERVPASIVEPRVPAAEAASSTSRAAPPAGVFLAGALLGLDPLDPEQVDVFVTTQRGDGTGGKGSREARYAIDVTELLDSPQGAPPAFYVTAVHPAGRKDSREFPLPDAARSAAREEHTELELDLDLSPRTTVVGRVKPCEGRWPDEIHVALIAGAEVVCGAECDEQGAFILHPRSGGAYTLVARAGQVPSVTHAVRVSERELHDVGLLVLEPGGLALEGVVRPPFPARVEGWTVRASRMLVGSEAFTWEGVAGREDRMDVIEDRGRVHADGAFRITGLSPGSYALALEQDSGPEILACAAELEVTAPASNLLLGTRLVTTRVGVVSEEAFEEATLEVRGGGRNARRQVTPGTEVEVIGDLREPLVLSAEAPGFVRAERELSVETGAPAQRVELVLRPDERATLELEWTLAEGRVAPELITACWTRDGEEGEASVRAGPRGCRFESWKPGRYRVVLEPRGSSEWEPVVTLLRAEPLEVELFAGGRTRATVAWELGGKATFVPEATGTRREAAPPVEVRDASGSVLAVRFVQRQYDDGTITFGNFIGAMPLRGECELRPTLPPGSYVLHLTLDDEPLRVPFAVLAGERVTVPFAVP